MGVGYGMWSLGCTVWGVGCGVWGTDATHLPGAPCVVVVRDRSNMADRNTIIVEVTKEFILCGIIWNLKTKTKRMLIKLKKNNTIIFALGKHTSTQLFSVIMSLTFSFLNQFHDIIE